MGNCFANDPDKAQDRDVGRDLEKDKSKDKLVKKLLFLGAGGSGKSTLFKQLRSIHGSGWTKEDRLTFVDHIHAQIIEQMKLALETIELDALEELKEQNEDVEDYKAPADHNPFAHFAPQAQQAIVTLRSVKDPKLTASTADACQTLWAEESIHEMYEQRAQIGIEDSTKYFWDKIDAVMADGYVPDAEDILLVRYRTTGVIDQTFQIKKNTFHVFDVGGQKSERKKWIHCFEDVTAVIFVASLSCYDEVMFEDQEKNSMVDQLELFDKIVNDKTFEKTSVILFLNKKDLFAQRLSAGREITLCPAFKSYGGPSADIEATTDYIKGEFVAKNANNASESSVFTHLTCATDERNVEKVFNDVQHIIIENSLMSAGLMGDFGGDEEDDEEEDNAPDM